MPKTIVNKLLVLNVIFLLNCILVYGFNNPAEIRRKPPLSSYMAHLDGYKTLSQIEMEEKAVKMLKLDDYAFLDFLGDKGRINLYIGYYYSADKAYAAHSPLICYPSQGWKIDNRPVSSSLSVGPHKIYYEEIITSYGGDRELVLFWYQARLFTNTQGYKNKISMGYNKLVNNDEQHGFIRVSVPLQDSYDEAKVAATRFISDFYPKLVEFIIEEG